MPLPVLSQVHLDELEQVIPTLLSGAFQNTDPLLSDIPMAAPSALLCLQGPPGFLLKDIPMACNPLGSLPGGFTPSPPSPGAPCCFHPLEKQGSEGSLRSLGTPRTPQGIEGLGSHPVGSRMSHAGRATAVSTKLLHFQDNPPPWFSQRQGSCQVWSLGPGCVSTALSHFCFLRQKVSAFCPKAIGFQRDSSHLGHRQHSREFLHSSSPGLNSFGKGCKVQSGSK